MQTPLASVADALTLPRRPKVDPDMEQRDIHEIDALLANTPMLTEVLDSVRGGVSGMFRPQKLRTIKGMGTVYDYRPFTHGNGPLIKPQFLVEHIPVIRQMDGRADLDVLWRVLVAQGLMVHNGTDGEGNVAFYCQMNRLCFQARGGNSVSCGTEHMHLTTLEGWSEKQLNASAFLSHRAKEHYGIPRRRGKCSTGPGVIGVRRRGHITHEEVSNAAGFHDRSDPGDKYEALMDEVEKRSIFYSKHHHF